MRRRSTSLLVGLWLTLIVPAGAGAQTYLPLELGQTWELENAAGESWRTRVAARTTLEGRDVLRLVHRTPDGELWNYWSEGPGGTILLHGFFLPELQSGVVYEPPLEWIQAEPTRGVAWQTQASVLDFASGEPRGTLTLSVSVGPRRTIRLPLGDYLVCPLEYSTTGAPALSDVSDPTGTSLLDRDARGKTAPAPDGSLLRQEYALGHGLIRETVCCPEDVRLLQDHQVPVEPERWGVLKARYRDAAPAKSQEQ